MSTTWRVSFKAMGGDTTVKHIEASSRREAKEKFAKALHIAVSSRIKATPLK